MISKRQRELDALAVQLNHDAGELSNWDFQTRLFKEMNELGLSSEERTRYVWTAHGSFVPPDVEGRETLRWTSTYGGYIEWD